MTALATLGQVVTIYSGMTGRVVTTGNISRISPTGKKITVTLANGRQGSFYRQHESTRYVRNPGCGLAGNILNDYFRL
jgi:hypothetical protein